MTGAVHVIGLVPGHTTGIAACSWMDGHLAYAWAAQVTPTLVLPLVGMLVNDLPGPVTLAIQRVHLPYGIDGDTHRQSLTRVLAQLHRPGLVAVHLQIDREVSWATTERLETAGIVDRLGGMRGPVLRAARHALHCAHRCGGVPDPLGQIGVSA